MIAHKIATRPELAQDTNRWTPSLFATQLATADGCAGSGPAKARGIADWLALAAAPTFALMALLTGVLGSSSDMLCAAMQDTSPLGGMAPMYLLMSAFHAGPWLRLIARRESAANRS